MPEILLGAAVLIGILVLLRLFVTANPAALARAVRYVGVVVLLAIAGTLAYLRYIAFAMIAASMAWGLYTRGHIWPSARSVGVFPFARWWWGPPGSSRGSRRPRRGPQAGQTSRVATAWLDLELDHDTGEMQGTVLQGKCAGKPLNALSPDDLLALHAEATNADSESARLLEAYLDRRLGPNWRLKRQEQQTKQEEHSAPRGRRDSGMSRDEAYAVLGLKPGAGEDDIRAAHKKLMMQNHPDRGGSDYLAAKINEAKDVLLN